MSSMVLGCEEILLELMATPTNLANQVEVGHARDQSHHVQSYIYMGLAFERVTVCNAGTWICGLLSSKNEKIAIFRMQWWLQLLMDFYQ